MCPCSSCPSRMFMAWPWAEFSSKFSNLIATLRTDGYRSRFLYSFLTLFQVTLLVIFSILFSPLSLHIECLSHKACLILILFLLVMVISIIYLGSWHLTLCLYGYFPYGTKTPDSNNLVLLVFPQFLNICPKHRWCLIKLG